MDLYVPLYENNGWKVRRHYEGFEHQKLIIYFNETRIAETETQACWEERIATIYRIKILEGFEELKETLELVLYAASREKVNEYENEVLEKKKLVEQARNQTKWLGPFK